MTKRRKQYEEKRKAKQLRIHRATDYVMRGLDPYIASKHFAIFDEGIRKNLAMLHIPKKPNWKERYAAFDKMMSDDMRIWNLWKKKSWIEKAKEKFLGKLNSDVEKQYIKDTK